MKIIKKMFFCVLISAFCLISGLLCINNESTLLFPMAFAAESGSWGDNLTWNLDDEGTLSVSGTGAMAGSTSENPFPWTEYKNLINKVIIEDGVTSIASDAFYRCEAITALTLSKDIEIINSYSFYYCSSLENITVPTDSALTTIGSNAFSQCTALEYIFIPDSVTSIGASAFSGAALKTAELSEDSNLREIQSSSFSGTKIESFYIPASVKSIDSMAFMSASALKEIIVSVDNNYFTSADGVLFDKQMETLVCYPAAKSDTEYTIPSGVRLISGHSFYKNQNIITLNIPNTVTSVGKSCCQYMSSLEYVNFEKDIQLKAIPEYAFSDNTKLKEINIPNSIVTLNTHTFGNCNNVQKIVFEENSKLETIGSFAFSRIYGISEDIIIPHTVKTISSGAFYECKFNGKRIVFPENGQLEVIGSSAFSDVRLYERTLFIPSSVKTIGSSAFSWYTANASNKHIETIYYGGSEEQWNLIDIDENNKDIFNADIIFDYNPSLYENLTIEKNGTVINISGSGEIPASGVQSYRPWNEYKSDSTAVVINGDISSLGKNSFTDFSELIYIIIRTPYITIEDGAFSNCPKLETVIILGNSEFTANAFTGCAENIRIFEEKSKQHSFGVSTENIAVIPFAYSENILFFEGKLTLDAYEFFDIISVFATEYENISRLKLTEFSFEDIVLYRYDEENMSRVPIDNNTISNGEIYTQAFIEGELKDISFNELCEGMANGSITDFYLIAADEANGQLENTQMEVIEQLKGFILRAIRWVVTLMNKLFRILKSFFG